MEYIEVFNQLDQEISEKIEDLQKQQEKLLERKKYLLETKQKIHCFLSDAYEMKQLLDFNPHLSKTVSLELNKIFHSEDESVILAESQAEETVIESNVNDIQEQELENETENENDLDTYTEEEQPIKLYKFVDSQGKDTLF